MSPAHVLILGAGFAGLELATRLSSTLGDEVRITLVDQSDSFVFGFSKLDVLFGRRSADDVRVYYRDLIKNHVDFRRERITDIDPTNRRVTTDAGRHEADILVVALGADYDPGATPGFVEGGHDYYTVEGAERLRDALTTFDTGKVVIAILGAPFKCPPAPFEGAFLLHDHFTKRGVRDAIDIRVISPMDSPIPVSKDVSQAIVDGLAQRGVECRFGQLVVSIDPSTKTATTSDGGTVAYDLLIGIPKHRVPAVVEASGLTEGGTDGWVHVDPTNLATPFPGVYAVGDVADAPVPRAGVFAETAARAAADDIIGGLRGSGPGRPFDGTGACYIEFGGGLVGKVDANFLGGPTPTARLVGPSKELAVEKAEFASTRRERWFGP